MSCLERCIWQRDIVYLEMDNVYLEKDNTYLEQRDNGCLEMDDASLGIRAIWRWLMPI